MVPRVKKMAEMYEGMADADVVIQLDILFVTLTVLTALHAISKRGLFSGIAVVAFIFLHTVAFEHVSLFLGGTHCHASSPVLAMVTPCSSINSVLFYVPWIYTSLEAARRLNLRPAAFPLAVGLLQIGFGAVYEMQGPWNSFWHWPDEKGIIAKSPLLERWENYPPLDFLSEAKLNGEVATITSGVFRVSQHADGALAERLYGFPIFAPYFHFAFGFGWAVGLLFTGSVGSEAPPSLKRIAIAGLLTTVLFLFPIWITRGLCQVARIQLSVGVPLSLLLSFIALLVIEKRKKKTSSVSALKPDVLLFVISAAMHAFMVSFPLRAPKPPPSGLHSLVAFTATAHLIAQYVCCFMTGSKQIDKIE